MSKLYSQPGEKGTDTNQASEDWKLERQKYLKEFKSLLNKNEHTREQQDRLQFIEKKFGQHEMFKQAAKDNYDARANSGWGGFGAPDCYCHISPPCQACVNWTNFCEERKDAVSNNKEPGCVIINHDCEVVRNPA